jgi:DUF971 family protein
MEIQLYPLASAPKRAFLLQQIMTVTMLAPTEIKRLGSDGLQITWPDCTHTISSETLRRNCPSASSRAERGDDSHDKPLIQKKKSLTVLKASKAEETDLVRIWAIGQYAIGIAWADGHSSGIYPFNLLRQLGAPPVS